MNNREDEDNLETLMTWCQNHDAALMLRHLPNNRWRILISLFPRAMREEIIFEQYSVSLSTLFTNGVEAIRRRDEARHTPELSPKRGWKRGW